MGIKKLLAVLQNIFLMIWTLVTAIRNRISPFVMQSVIKRNRTNSKIILKQPFRRKKRRLYILKLLFYTVLKQVQCFCFGFHCIINLNKCKKVQINWKINRNSKQLWCGSKPTSFFFSFAWYQYNMKEWLAMLPVWFFLLVFCTTCQISLPDCFPCLLI